MLSEISNHRKGAYLYGFLSGIGLTMLTWGIASVIGSSAPNLATFMALNLFGISLLAFGSCREAYLRGILSVASPSAADRSQKAPVATNAQESVLCEQEQPTQANQEQPVVTSAQEPVLCEQGQPNQA